MDKAREEFSQHINIIRNVCSQFETEVLGDVMKMGVGADPAFRKHFTHLKVEQTKFCVCCSLTDPMILGTSCFGKYSNARKRYFKDNKGIL